DVVVSTVHRAKGLEFDNVAVLDFPQRHAPERPVEDARRTQFVALTRARNHLVRADGPDDRALRTIATRGSQRARWYIGAHKPWMTLGIEIQVGDIEPIHEDPNASQATLLSAVAPGDALTLDLDVDASTLTLPVYSVAHDGNPVGRTSHSFGDALASRIGNLESRRNTWPT
ncbi:3'-5' exonuclease, partial [Cellulomonas telluris]|uniref:3'-5' exonuclease n=1 Tax=Cellulomonas telluris TaxID=2306636 RepID=UPI00145627C9